MKRFYKAASVIAAPEGLSGFQVALDGRPVKSPAKADLVVPTRPLAEAVAAEWADQGDKVAPDTMPLMTLVATATDRVMPQKDAVAADLAAYGGSDLICYRADRQQDLRERQDAAWDPLIAWVQQSYGAELSVTSGIMPVSQPNTALMLLARRVGGLDAFELTALHALTTVTGSLVLGLAVLEGRLDADAAFEASQLDEDHQASLWGEDSEAKARQERMRREIAEASRFLTLLRS